MSLQYWEKQQHSFTPLLKSNKLIVKRYKMHLWQVFPVINVSRCFLVFNWRYRTLTGRHIKALLPFFLVRLALTEMHFCASLIQLNAHLVFSLDCLNLKGRKIPTDCCHQLSQWKITMKVRTTPVLLKACKQLTAAQDINACRKFCLNHAINEWCKWWLFNALSIFIFNPFLHHHVHVCWGEGPLPESRCTHS